MEEDENTEKIDNEAPSVNNKFLDQIQAAEKDNKVNEEMLKKTPVKTIPKTETIVTQKPDAPRIASQEYSQPQVEVINAGDGRTSENCPAALLATSSDVSGGEEDRPKARVAFADPTLRSNPSTPVRAAVSESSAPVRAGPSEEEMTLSSLGPEDASQDVNVPIPVIETSSKVTAPLKETPPIPSPKVKEAKEENQLPTLGNRRY